MVLCWKNFFFFFFQKFHIKQFGAIDGICEMQDALDMYISEWMKSYTFAKSVMSHVNIFR